jgi:N-acetylglutamate synthase-like GNAT family acetyltransferase
MQQGTILRRSFEDIHQKKDDYVVYVIDSKIYACAALQDWGEGPSSSS